MGSPLHCRYVLGQRVDVTTYASATNLVLDCARQGIPGYVCISNVHMVMEGWDDPGFRDCVNRATLITPDGMPLVWALRLKGVHGATRVRGLDLMVRVLEAATIEGVAVGFLGSTAETLARLRASVARSHPSLHVAYTYAPPFRVLSPKEDSELVESINESGIRILFVGLGCPKQERWMAEHHRRIHALMLGVGAGFDFIAGTKREAPRLLGNLGLEWLFRLSTEPTRLWKRYLRHNPRFVLRLSLDLLSSRWSKA